jgi:very-long-chain enoyl-CoA reductase
MTSIPSDTPAAAPGVTLCYGKRTQSIAAPIDANGSYLFGKAVAFSRLGKSRVRVVYEHNGKRIPVGDSQLLSSLHTQTFIIRDLGPQFSYAGVFLVEYSGPAAIWLLLIALFRPPWTLYFKLASIMWFSHYIKRLLETTFVHIFSHGTMPLFNLFKNSLYYWGFAAAIGWAVARRSESVGELSLFQYAGFALFWVFEGLNLYCHIALRNLRSNGSTEHKLPRGFLFDSIISPNYTVEILAWLAFATFVRVLPAWVFVIAGTAQMWVWAEKKRRMLIADYPEAKTRGRLTPFRFL